MGKRRRSPFDELQGPNVTATCGRSIHRLFIGYDRESVHPNKNRRDRSISNSTGIKCLLRLEGNQ